MTINDFALQLFKAFPLPSVLLKVDAPIFTVVAVNNALLYVSQNSSESELLGKGLFEIFPDNPNDIDANGVSNLKASLVKTIATGIVQEVPRQKYDIPVPNTTKFETRYWQAKNTPLFNEAGLVEYIIHTTEDITEKVLLEKKEKELEILIAQKNIILEHTESANEIGSWNLDIATGEFTWSPEFYKMCGYQPNAFTPTIENALQLIHPEDLEKVRAVYFDSIENGSPYRIEHRIIRADGYVILVLAVGVAIKNVDGKPIKLTGLFQNITSSKQLETMLRQNVSDLMASESRYKSLFENNPSPMYIWDFKTLKIVDCNEEALILYGYTREEFLSLTLKDITPVEDIHLIEELTRSEESYGRIHKRVWRHKKKNGDIIYLHIVGHLFSYNGRKVSLVSLSDITDKINAEEALKESETRYKSFFNNSLDANLLSIENGNILAANPVACKMFGYTEEEFCQLTRRDIADITDKRLINLLNDKKLTGHGEAIHRFFKKDGSVFEAYVSSTVYSDLNGEKRNAVIIKDIDEKLKAEAAIAASEKKYRLLFYQSPMPKWIYEEGTFRILEVNEAAIDHYGYSKAEFLNLTIFDLRPENEIDKLLTITNNQTRPKGLFKAGKFIHKKKNGRLITVEISSIPFEFEGKNCKLIIANDITDIEYALKELASSIERYHYVTKATSDAIWDWDLEKNKALWGEGFESIFGYNVSDTSSDISFLVNNIHPDDKQRILDEFYKILKSDRAQWQEEYRFRKSDSTFAYVINKVFIIRNSQQRVVRIVGGMRDITTRKKELLRLKLLESVITNINDGVIISEAEPSDEQGRRIVYVNEAFTKITGYTADDIIGKTSILLTGPKTDKNEIENIKHAMSYWQSYKTDIVNYKKNGEPFWANLSISPVLDDNVWFTNWVAIQRDVTEQKQHVTEMIKAIIKTQEDERFEIGSELHDNVCQILATSKVSFKMLEKNITGKDSFWFKQGIEQIDMVFKEVRNLSHRLAPTFFADTSLEKCLTSLVKTFNLEADYNITITFDHSFKSHNTSKDFQLNMYRILQEQLRNIVKYAEAKNITISGFTTNQHLLMVVADDGIGFDPSAVTTGIGLANIKRRTELFNGQFLLDTAPGKGCKITIDIPIKDAT